MSEKRTPLVSIDDLAITLGVSVSTVRSWVRGGEIPRQTYIRVGNTYRFEQEEVISALKDGSETVEEARPTGYANKKNKEAVGGQISESQQTIKELIKIGRERGFVTHDELDAGLPAEEYTTEEIDEVMSTLNEMGVSVVVVDEKEGSAALKAQASDWSEQELLILRECWTHNMPISTIGRLIGKSRNAVAKKAYEIQLPKRENANSSVGQDEPVEAPYLRAAKDGDVNAQFFLAYLYADGGFNVEHDEEKSRYWYKKAAENGHLEAWRICQELDKAIGKSLNFSNEEWTRCYYETKFMFDEIYKLSDQNQFCDDATKIANNRAIFKIAVSHFGDLIDFGGEVDCHDYDTLMCGDEPDNAYQDAGKTFSNREWTLYYYRTSEMLNNIRELSDLNEYCTHEKRSADLNRAILLIAEMHTGDLFGIESSDYERLMSEKNVPHPLSEESLITQGCDTWSENLWR